MQRHQLDDKNSTKAIHEKLGFSSNQFMSNGAVSKLITSTKLKKIAYGSSADIFSGRYNNEQVILKKFRINHITTSEHALSKLYKEWDVLTACFPSNYIVKPISYSIQPPIIVMENVSNGALDLYLKGKATLTHKQKLRIAKDITLGIIDLLKHGICHRDIKTANILLDKNLRAKLNDFDLSCKEKSVSCMHLAGTIEYMAPEYFMDDVEDIDLPRADIYSLGVVLLELILEPKIYNYYEKETDKSSGRSARAAYHRQGMLFRFIEDHSHKWPEGYGALVKSCLDLHPDKRPDIYNVHKKLTDILKCIEDKPALSMEKVGYSSLSQPLYPSRDNRDLQGESQVTRCCIML